MCVGVTDVNSHLVSGYVALVSVFVKSRITATRRVLSYVIPAATADDPRLSVA